MSSKYAHKRMLTHLTILFNFISIFVFGFIYMFFEQGNFKSNIPGTKLQLIDFLFFSVNIQVRTPTCAVAAISDFGKIVVMIQQLILLVSAVIIVELYLVEK